MFDFLPTLVWIVASESETEGPYPVQGSGECAMLPVYLMPNTKTWSFGFYTDPEYRSNANGWRDGNTIYWYVQHAQITAALQFNSSGWTYHWVAIG